MIPTSYLFKNLYHDRFGDPRNPHAVEVPAAPTTGPRGGIHLPALAAILGIFANARPVSANGSVQPCS